MPKINKNSTLAEILKDPEAEKVLIKHKLPCLHCPMAAYELGVLKIGEVSEMYGMDLEGLLKDVESLGKGKKSKATPKPKAKPKAKDKK